MTSMYTRNNINEDKVSLFIGVLIFLVSLLSLFDINSLGWVVRTNVWLDYNTVFKATSYQISGLFSLFLTYGSILGILCILFKWFKRDLNVLNFIKSFTIVFFLAVFCYSLGSYAYIALTPDKIAKFGIDWSLGLSAESGYIFALLAGLILGNFFPSVAASLKEACRPELFIKIAVIIMGAELGLKTATAIDLTSSIVFRGFCAIIEAYLIYWALVYFVSRKYFKLNREYAAPLASGISICGVSAAIATGSAIRARSEVVAMICSLVIIFTCIEMLILPWVAQYFLYTDPLVAGSWMGLAVKSDGGAIASGAITDALIRAKSLTEQGIVYEEGWITMVATTVKIFIDIFIGIWSFVLAYIWSTKFNKTENAMTKREIWNRFPKFIIGYLATFLIILFFSTQLESGKELCSQLTKSINSFRSLFFLLTFFSIGVLTNFKTLFSQGLAKLAGVYVVCLFGFIIWIGLFISWLYFSGTFPPIIVN